ncbi:MAG: hypothetical protein Ctma_0832 [Catillopecten margaritatus gill symbiont]|uniref:Uncharacterized protein TP-0789 domain-containing protein n=1 Tax=Catillopecten margaritatus gill symbiont TaxID=3083288 RepID=A0AAU6PGH2_9GAMM
MNILNLLFLALFALPAMAQMSAMELLVKADTFRSPFTHAQLDIKIDEYKNGKIKKSRHYKVFHQDGQSLVSVLDGSDKGNRILLSHKGMFVAPKNSSRAVRITPIQRLLGQASYGDLAGLRFSENYTPTILKQAKNTITLKLIAKKSSATYHKIVLVIAQDDQRPIDAQAYLRSGKLYKKMHYNVKDDTLKSITYTSKKQKTVMNFLGVKGKKIPKRLLTSRGMRNAIR